MGDIVELGMIGLGKMGANMAERLVGAGHRVIGFDLVATAGRWTVFADAAIDRVSAPSVA